MRQMVLDAEILNSLSWRLGAEFYGELGGGVIGVGIRRDHPRVHPVKLLEIADHPTESRISLVGFQVANVLAQEDLRTNRQRDRILQMRAHSQGARRLGNGRATRGGW